MGLSDAYDGDAWIDFLRRVSVGDADQVTEWLTVHVTSSRDEAMLLSMVPRAIALTVKKILIADGFDDVDSWTFQAPPDAQPAETLGAQLIGACLNDDRDVVIGITAAVDEAPDDFYVEVVGFLLAALRQTMHDAAERMRR